MKTLIFAILVLTTNQLLAQVTVFWVGGTPGKETTWEEARNWSDNRVPNEFSDVFIPDVSTSTFAYPVITSGLVELNSLLVASNSSLTVEQAAQVIIYEPKEGFSVDNLILRGTVLLIDAEGKELNAMALKSGQ